MADRAPPICSCEPAIAGQVVGKRIPIVEKFGAVIYLNISSASHKMPPVSFRIHQFKAQIKLKPHE